MKLAFCRLDNLTGHEAGRALLQQLYFEETGEQMPTVYLSDTGKPYFRNCKYHFSITHTSRHAFCALSEKRIGIDAEELDRVINPKLITRVLSPMEKAQYEEAVDANFAFLTLWVLKEASAKLSGEGLQGFPNHTSFRLDDPNVHQIDGCLVAILEED